jgi:hypothetical protein
MNDDNETIDTRDIPENETADHSNSIKIIDCNSKVEPEVDMVGTSTDEYSTHKDSGTFSEPSLHTSSDPHHAEILPESVVDDDPHSLLEPTGRVVQWDYEAIQFPSSSSPSNNQSDPSWELKLSGFFPVELDPEPIPEPTPPPMERGSDWRWDKHPRYEIAQALELIDEEIAELEKEPLGRNRGRKTIHRRLRAKYSEIARERNQRMEKIKPWIVDKGVQRLVNTRWALWHGAYKLRELAPKQLAMSFLGEDTTHRISRKLARIILKELWRYGKSIHLNRLRKYTADEIEKLEIKKKNERLGLMGGRQSYDKSRVYDPISGRYVRGPNGLVLNRDLDGPEELRILSKRRRKEIAKRIKNTLHSLYR